LSNITKFTGAITCKRWVLLQTVKSMIFKNIFILQKVAIILLGKKIIS
jgi:hypothetical protein